MCVGTVEDAPALMKTLNVALETSKTLAFETHGYPRPRGACQELLRAIETLLQRGMRPAADPKDPAEIAVFLVALRKEPSFRPEGWEARGLKWLEHPVPVLREHTLLSAPKPFPAEFIKALPRLILDCDADVQIAALHLAADQKTPDLKDPVLKCYATATEDWVRRSAFDAGVALGSRFEMLMILADRLDAENPGSTLPSLIEGTVATGGWGSTTAKPEDKPGLKARWMDFLKANEARFRANKLFTPGDPTLDPRLFVGWSFSLGDGTEWPRCDSTPH